MFDKKMKFLIIVSICSLIALFVVVSIGKSNDVIPDRCINSCTKYGGEVISYTDYPYENSECWCLKDDLPFQFPVED